MTGNSHLLGYGSVVSLAGGAYGFLSNAVAGVPVGMLTPESLPTLIAASVGVALGLGAYFKRQKEDTDNVRFAGINFAFQNAQELLKAETVQHNITRKLY